MPEENKIIIDDKKAKDLENKGNSLAIPIEEWKPHVEALKKEIESSKRDQVTILGIFASFITFTSVDFQLLKNISNVGDYIALTLLLLASMLLFVFGLKYLIAEDVDGNFYKKPLFVVISILVTLSILVYSVPRFITLVGMRNPSNAGFFYMSYR